MHSDFLLRPSEKCGQNLSNKLIKEEFCNNAAFFNKVRQLNANKTHKSEILILS